jgi:uncharacterized GH25 family protein
MSCAPPIGGFSIEGVDVAKETVISGTVLAAGEPVGGAYVRLLDSSGEFTAEVVTDDAGGFRFFARPGTWTLRALSPRGNADAEVKAVLGEAIEAVITVA